MVAVTRKKRRARKNGRDKEIETGRTVKKGQAETRKQRQKIGVHQTTGSQVTVTVPHPAREPSTPSIANQQIETKILRKAAKGRPTTKVLCRRSSASPKRDKGSCWPERAGKVPEK